MAVVRVDSLNDPRLVPYRHLKKTNESRVGEHFIVEGEKLVERLLRSRYPVESAVATESCLVKLLPQLNRDVPVYLLPQSDIEELVGFNFHRGVLARASRLPGPNLGSLLATHLHTLLLVVCPDVQDPENLGALCRNCSAFGVDGLILGPRCADPFSRRVLRVSMGTVLRLPIVESADLAGDLDRLRAAGVELVATVLDLQAERLSQAAQSERMALLFGSEGHGLERRWIEQSDRRLTIPMHPETDSLNVAVASGIFLHWLTQARPR